ncbi:hypothetical protein GOBAR_AA19158 [Gossypium barbadense]|uniref:Protein kinase domain-containing protein n=1 Tax=Gossypium barbadense TaxID=3634 RepID=A0A2P5XDU0_GOSBA|nr:hypothetical protein GOBAR_AA19158 [Gossypium barbadense]
MESLWELVSSKSWGTVFKEDPKYNIFGLAQCYQDVNADDCELCFKTSQEKLQQCIPARSGRVYLDQCFHRFDHYNFYNEGVDPKYDHVTCGSPTGDSNDTYMSQDFQSKLDHVILNVEEAALRKNGFGTTEVKGGVVTVYALAQCWKTIDKQACDKCLTDAGMRLRECGPAAEGRALFTGCYMRYSTNRFFDHGSGTVEKKGFTDWVTLGVALSGATFLLLAVVGAFVTGLDALPATGLKTSLNFKYEMLEKATNNFNESMKLGQGGAGSVFKGVLPNAEAVAVKRLFFNTRQWVDQFFNEVNLISGIQHKNLVRLLGCSIEGPESLLVYEYVPNRSLDQILFSKDKRYILSWSQRGYMAPEYLVRGQLTEKADVYGFGVLVLEIATGRKNSVFSEGSSSILYSNMDRGALNTVLFNQVWKQYKADHITQSIDPGLEGKFEEREASTALLVGLLCTQPSVAIRPSMHDVLHMLTNANSEIPCPKQPPFLTASVLSPAHTPDDSFAMDSSALDQPKTGSESSTQKAIGH